MALEKLVRTNGNSDLDRFVGPLLLISIGTCEPTNLPKSTNHQRSHSVIPGLVQALKDPAHNVQAIDDLASCVFVQDVEAPAIAVIMPIIRRGLRVKVRARVRTCARAGGRAWLWLSSSCDRGDLTRLVA